MKDIGSVTGRLVRDPTASSETGSQRGETGYHARPPRSYGLDHEPTAPPEAAVPARVSEPPTTNALITSNPFPAFSPLPDSKPLLVVLPSGRTRLAVSLTNPSELSLVQARIGELEEELEPVNPLLLVSRLRVLFAHYGQQLPTEETLLKAVVADWVSDLQDVSAKAFEAAINAWRQSKERFKPSPGQILAIAREYEAPLRRQLERCFEIEWVATKTRPEPPKQLAE